MLTLASNERIPLTPSMRLLLEINHMNHCSPATVSRGGGDLRQRRGRRVGAGVAVLAGEGCACRPAADSAVPGHQVRVNSTMSQQHVCMD